MALDIVIAVAVAVVIVTVVSTSYNSTLVAEDAKADCLDDDGTTLILIDS